MENGNYRYIKPVLLRPRLLSGLSLAGSELLNLPRVFPFQSFSRVNLTPDLCFLTSAEDNCMNLFLLLKKLCQYFDRTR